MAKEKLSFEQALEKLEAIVGEIESGKVPLEESITKYAQGIELVKQCRTILDSAEKKIQMLARKEGGLEADGELPEAEDAAGQDEAKTPF
ncbi:MAG: exodeoxyribonuclease VII small subunit [Planctomycetes bacterium]|jgi:exodeoxyribonuclease VII small subunit|nr:exodeoxyribonuclease VII small subunit [Planctomycetota bacterium]